MLLGILGVICASLFLVLGRLYAQSMCTNRANPYRAQLYPGVCYANPAASELAHMVPTASSLMEP